MEWTKITDELSLPKQGGSYWVFKNGQVVEATYVKNNRWITDNYHYPETAESHGITHYQKLFIPQAPNN